MDLSESFSGFRVVESLHESDAPVMGLEDRPELFHRDTRVLISFPFGLNFCRIGLTRAARAGSRPTAPWRTEQSGNHQGEETT